MLWKMGGLVQALVFLNAAAIAYSQPQPRPDPQPQPQPQPQPKTVFNVLDFHASGDGLTDDTKAFTDTWSAACHTQNALMMVPSLRTFLVMPLYFDGPCTPGFVLQVDGIIVAPEDPDIYGASKHWIEIKEVFEFIMLGDGVIDGQGHTWWDSSCKRNRHNPCKKAPTSIIFSNCSNVTLQKLTLKNSQQMAISFAQSTNIIVEGLSILNPHDSPNTDGIHIEKSQFILIQDTTIETGDDCISIATGSSDILIQNIKCGPGHGISIGSLGKMRSVAEVSNIIVQNIILSNTTNGLRIKTWQGGKGRVATIKYRNIQMFDVANPLIIDEFYCDKHESFTCGLEDRSVEVTDVVYSNIVGTSSTDVAVRFQCSRPTPCTNIFVENIHLTLPNGGDTSSFCKNAFGGNGGGVIPPSCLALY